MRKLTILFALLTLSAGLAQADDPDPLIEVKAAAIEAIESAATTARVEIDVASKYAAADATKEYYKTEVGRAVIVATSAINAASTVADVDAERAKCTLEINAIVTEAKAAIAPIDALEEHREKVIGEIEYARLHNLLPELDEEQQGFVNETIDDAVNAVNAATTTTQMDRAEAKIFFILSMYPAGRAEGIEEGQAEALGEMGEPCTDCPAVEVTKGNKTIKLYAPDKVEFIKK